MIFARIFRYFEHIANVRFIGKKESKVNQAKFSTIFKFPPIYIDLEQYTYQFILIAIYLTVHMIYLTVKDGIIKFKCLDFLS